MWVIRLEIYSMVYNKNKIKESIGSALKDLDMQPEKIAEAVFHMTDWISDLEEWHSFCDNPESLSNDELQDLLMEFLIHVPNHVAAASKLITEIPVEDIFEVGAIQESIAKAIGRIKKGKFLGQEVELSGELIKLQQSATEASEEVASLPLSESKYQSCQVSI